MPPLPLDDDLALAHRLADLGAEVALDFYRRGVKTIWKEDDTPVSEADLEVDRQLVEMLRRERPDDAILSEESGESGESGTRGASGRRWILDPIDGTFNFVEGRPAWGNHVALEVDGAIVLGVITRPVYGMRWWATLGGGAFRSEASPDGAGTADPGTRLRVSAVDDMAQSRVTVWSQQPHELVERLRRSSVLVEGTLDRVLEVIQGDLEAVVAAGGRIWDHAPAVIMITEAGGRFRDPEGGRRPDLGESHYSNGLIDAQLDRVIAG